MKAYVARFKGLVITTEDWLAHLHAYWSPFPDKVDALKAVDWDVRFSSLPVRAFADLAPRHGYTAKASPSPSTSVLPPSSDRA